MNLNDEGGEATRRWKITFPFSVLAGYVWGVVLCGGFCNQADTFSSIRKAVSWIPRWGIGAFRKLYLGSGGIFQSQWLRIAHLDTFPSSISPTHILCFTHTHTHTHTRMHSSSYEEEDGSEQLGNLTLENTKDRQVHFQNLGLVVEVLVLPQPLSWPTGTVQKSWGKWTLLHHFILWETNDSFLGNGEYLQKCILVPSLLQSKYLPWLLFSCSDKIYRNGAPEPKAWDLNGNQQTFRELWPQRGGAGFLTNIPRLTHPHKPGPLQNSQNVGIYFKGDND